METISLVKETVEKLFCQKVLKDKNVKIVVDGAVNKVLFNYLNIKRALQSLLIKTGCVSKKGGDIKVHVKDLNDNIHISLKDY